MAKACRRPIHFLRLPYTVTYPNGWFRGNSNSRASIASRAAFSDIQSAAKLGESAKYDIKLASEAAPHETPRSTTWQVRIAA